MSLCDRDVVILVYDFVYVYVDIDGRINIDVRASQSQSLVKVALKLRKIMPISLESFSDTALLVPLRGLSSVNHQS